MSATNTQQHLTFCAARLRTADREKARKPKQSLVSNSPQQLYHLHDRPASSAIPVRATAARLTYRPTVLDCQPVERACERRSFGCAESELCKSCFVAGWLAGWLRDCQCTAFYPDTTKIRRVKIL